MIFYRDNQYMYELCQKLDCTLLPHTMFQSQCKTCIVCFLLYVWSTSDLPKGFLIKYKLKSAPRIFLNMVFLINSSDELILLLIMIYHSSLIEEDKAQRY